MTSQSNHWDRRRERECQINSNLTPSINFIFHKEANEDVIWLASGLWNEVCKIIWLWETGCDAYDECGAWDSGGPDLLDQLVQWMDWMDGTSFDLQCCLSMMTTYWSQVHLSMLVSISINDHTVGGEFIYSHILEEHNKISHWRTSGLKFCQNNWFTFWQRQKYH